VSDQPPLPRGTLAGIAEDLETARRRMKHLAPWHVAPLPQTQVGRTGTATQPVSSTEQARRKHLALQVLAVQMGNARPGSALR
jgi:hypothetical protein